MRKDTSSPQIDLETPDLLPSSLDEYRRTSPNERRWIKAHRRDLYNRFEKQLKEETTR